MGNSPGDVSALLRLLDEEDPTAAEAMIEHVARMNEDALRGLEAAARNGARTARRNLQQAIVRHRYRAAEVDWAQLSERATPSLEAGLILIARTGGDAGEPEIAGQLDDLAARVGARLSGDRAYDTGLKALADVLYGEAGLEGNRDDYLDPRNSYLDQVLARGRGIPISLCSVAILVARRLDLPVHGIGAPGHFLGFYGDAELGFGSFFDPFSGFRQLNQGSLQKLLSSYVERLEPAMLRPATDREILARTLRNLLSSYNRQGDVEHERNLIQWLEMLSARGFRATTDHKRG
jgi:regulator of sirC expression with transglutaminase-like and TPR domain